MQIILSPKTLPHNTGCIMPCWKVDEWFLYLDYFRYDQTEFCGVDMTGVVESLTKFCDKSIQKFIVNNKLNESVSELDLNRVYTFKIK